MSLHSPLLPPSLLTLFLPAKIYSIFVEKNFLSAFVFSPDYGNCCSSCCCLFASSACGFWLRCIADVVVVDVVAVCVRVWLLFCLLAEITNVIIMPGDTKVVPGLRHVDEAFQLTAIQLHMYRQSPLSPSLPPSPLSGTYGQTIN